MNQLSNLNATIVKEVVYDASLQPSATTLNFTVENCHTNAYIERIVFYLSGADANFGAQTQITLLDRGNGYASAINGFIPVTFTTIGSTVTTTGGTLTAPVITQAQNSTTVTAIVEQSVQDAEGLGNIYVKLTRSSGSYNVGFTMAVIYRPETTYNTKLNTRNQESNDKPARILSQVGTGTYGATASVMTDQTNFVAHNYNPRNNVDTTTFGFNVTSSNPIFYFGTPYPTKRWFLGFSSDNTPNLGIITFSYFNGTAFTAFPSANVANGCLGPGTYKFANDGIVIFTPPSDWVGLSMANDPLTIYNNTIIGLGTLATNNTVRNPGIFWVQCQVGFATTAASSNQTLTIATVTPLIDPALALTFRRRLI